ncbi:hypothetical protein B0H14DRAFT_1242066 [Mycena olivaceomarginata]|nr:hypothetical protein B0H14DRAFT_1242066 [Mycena olivaceomarginata]
MQFSRLALIPLHRHRVHPRRRAGTRVPGTRSSTSARAAPPAGATAASQTAASATLRRANPTQSVARPPTATAGAATYVCTSGSGHWVQTAKCAARIPEWRMPADDILQRALCLGNQVKISRSRCRSGISTVCSVGCMIHERVFSTPYTTRRASQSSRLMNLCM